ncbi:amidohydrolase family protein [Hydrogenoanaerobacterium sp.]|uniref:amidohydrolase family protein n=1 Tax=Hydrogenoanaerobacterium sp. TaxID=2953763 RepID=UPI0028A29CF3|nr:amidohydrolase family protein [Hydrogenoanaerobacterium sp.]
MNNNAFALKGSVIYSQDCNTLVSAATSYLICEDGKVAGVFETIPSRFEGIPITDYGNKLIIPGLIDLHVHAPQYTYRALGMDLELLPWLNTYAFPEEAKYAEEAYARKAYGRFTRALSASATTRAAIFATLHVPATNILMDLVEQTGVQAYIGKVNMDRNSPDNLIETTVQSVEATEKWLKGCVGRYENCKPMLTPRFIPSCSNELMAGLGELQRKYKLPLQSHLSENASEIAWVQQLHPDTHCYGDAYEKYGVFGGECPTIMAHCVHPNEAELELMDKNGVFIAHCPQSNMNICSGVAPVRTYLERNMRVGLGSDVAGGADLSIFKAMADAIRASKLRWALKDKTLAPLTVPEAFYLATKGGGAFWGKVGSFEEGYEFDAVVLDDSNLEGSEEFSVQQRLERIIYLSDDRNVIHKFIKGKQIR